MADTSHTTSVTSILHRAADVAQTQTQLARDRAHRARGKLRLKKENDDGHLSDLARAQARKEQLLKGLSHVSKADTVVDEREDLELYVMGEGSGGLLGVGNEHDCLSAVKLQGLAPGEQPIQVEANDYVSVIVTRGRDLLGWGLARDLGLSDDHKKKLFSPQPLPFFARRRVSFVSLGYHYMFVMTQEDEAYSWGRGNHKQLGYELPEGESFQFTPKKVDALSRQQIVQINCGDMHAAACTSRGYMLTWGNNDKGQLGIQFPVSTSCATPNYVPEFSKTGCFIVQVSCGYEATMAVSKAGELFSWGTGLTTGHNSGTVSKPRLLASLSRQFVVTVDVSVYHAAAITAQGRLYVWGRGPRLGLGAEVDCALHPTRVPGFTFDRALTVVCLRDATVVVTDTGRFIWWGTFHLRSELGGTSTKPDLVVGLNELETKPKIDFAVSQMHMLIIASPTTNIRRLHSYELFLLERSYVSTLTLLEEYYETPLSTLKVGSAPILSGIDTQRIFGNIISEILPLHRILTTALYHTTRAWYQHDEKTRSIAPLLFGDAVDCLRVVYRDYATTFRSSLELLVKRTNGSSRLAPILLRAEKYLQKFLAEENRVGLFTRDKGIRFTGHVTNLAGMLQAPLNHMNRMPLLWRAYRKTIERTAVDELRVCEVLSEDLMRIQKEFTQIALHPAHNALVSVHEKYSFLKNSLPPTSGRGYVWHSNDFHLAGAGVTKQCLLFVFTDVVHLCTRRGRPLHTLPLEYLWAKAAPPRKKTFKRLGSLLGDTQSVLTLQSICLDTVSAAADDSLPAAFRSGGALSSREPTAAAPATASTSDGSSNLSGAKSSLKGDALSPRPGDRAVLEVRLVGPTALTRRASRILLDASRKCLLRLKIRGHATYTVRSELTLLGSSVWMRIGSLGQQQAQVVQCAVGRGVAFLTSEQEVFVLDRRSSTRVGETRKPAQRPPRAVLFSGEDGAVASVRVISLAMGDTRLVVLDRQGRLWQAPLSAECLIARPWSLGPPAVSVSQVVAAYNSFAALTSDGVLYTWGQNQRGVLATGDLHDREEAHRVLFHGPSAADGAHGPSLSDSVSDLQQPVVTSVRLAFGHGMALTRDGRVYTWGSESAAMGHGQAVTNQLVPRAVERFDSLSLVSVDCHTYTSAFVDAEGVLYMCGTGALGHKSTNAQYIPVVVKGIQGAVVHVSCGEHHTMALTRYGALYSWGKNHHGQLGRGQGLSPDHESLRLPGVVPGFEYCRLERVYCGSSHTAVLAERLYRSLPILDSLSRTLGTSSDAGAELWWNDAVCCGSIPVPRHLFTEECPDPLQVDRDDLHELTIAHGYGEPLQVSLPGGATLCAMNQLVRSTFHVAETTSFGRTQPIAVSWFGVEVYPLLAKATQNHLSSPRLTILSSPYPDLCECVK